MTFDELKDRKIKAFYYIDHMNEGLGVNQPSENEYFLFQQEYLGDHAEWWIVIRHKPDGKILRLVNPKDVVDIIFEEK